MPASVYRLPSRHARADTRTPRAVAGVSGAGRIPPRRAVWDTLRRTAKASYEPVSSPKRMVRPQQSDLPRGRQSESDKLGMLPVALGMLPETPV